MATLCLTDGRCLQVTETYEDAKGQIGTLVGDLGQRFPRPFFEFHGVNGDEFVISCYAILEVRP